MGMDTHKTIENLKFKLSEANSTLQALIPVAKRQIKERFMLQVSGEELEREEAGTEHQSKRRAFLAAPQLLLKAIEVLRGKGLDIDEQKLKVT